MTALKMRIARVSWTQIPKLPMVVSIRSPQGYGICEEPPSINASMFLSTRWDIRVCIATSSRRPPKRPVQSTAERVVLEATPNSLQDLASSKPVHCRGLMRAFTLCHVVPPHSPVASSHCSASCEIAAVTAEFQLKAAGSLNGELSAQCPYAPRDR